MSSSSLIGGKVCEEFTPGYYGICTIGGMLSAGTTHLAITPLDVLKVNMQVKLLPCDREVMVRAMKTSLAEMQDKTVYNKPLWSDPSPTLT